MVDLQAVPQPREHRQVLVRPRPGRLGHHARVERDLGARPAVPDGLVQGRLVRKHAELLREEAARGAYTPRVDPDVLAYAIVRIGEAFLYNDAIIALEPNVEQACAVVRLLLD